MKRLRRTTLWDRVNLNARNLKLLKEELQREEEKARHSAQREWESDQAKMLNDKNESLWSMFNPSSRQEKEDQRRQAAFEAAVLASPTPARPPPRVVSEEQRKAKSQRDKEKSLAKAETIRRRRMEEGYDFYCPICQSVTPHMENPRECSRCGHGKRKG